MIRWRRACLSDPTGSANSTCRGSHSFHGESESGKSLIIQVECVRQINNGQSVLYLDFESDVRARSSLVSKTLVPNATRLPATSITCIPRYARIPRRNGATWAEMLSGNYALAVIDGVTDALGIFGCSTIDNDDVSAWIRTVPKQIAARTGAAVVLVDHVTKDTSNRNRWAIGGQAKMAGLTGAAYTVAVAAPLGRGMRGEVVLKIAKDRPGAVRPHCGSFTKHDRTQEAAHIIVDSTVSPPEVIVGAPGAGYAEPGQKAAFRPTTLMQRASTVIEEHPES